MLFSDWFMRQTIQGVLSRPDEERFLLNPRFSRPQAQLVDWFAMFDHIRHNAVIEGAAVKGRVGKSGPEFGAPTKRGL